jgi:signal transduction histidine kinase
MPVPPAAENSSTRPESTSPASWQPSVLLVDDHAGNLIALEAALAPLRLRLVRATSGAEALARVAEESFAVVLLDLRMPRLDGIETARLMRERSFQPHAPIIMVTAQTPEMDEIKKAYTHGVVDFLQKPFAAELLRAKVAVFAEMAAQREKLHRYEEASRKSFERQLVGIVSHDLRGPLNSILLSAEVALRKPDGLEAHRRSLETIKSAARRATRLIHDLLDYTQVLYGAALPVRRSRFSLLALVKEVVEELRVAHPQREISVQGSERAEGFWDADRLAQVITNLVNNAAKYGSDAAITVRVVDGEPEVGLEVHNFGAPIPAERVPELFQPLKRGSAMVSRGNIGFGLFIVHEVARAHGGTVSVHSTPELGTTFALRIPHSLDLERS